MQADKAQNVRLQGFAPQISRNCIMVVLGSFPSAASLAVGDYYAHPRNQFWPIMGNILGQPLTDWPYDKRYACLNRAGIGLWDVIAACRRPGSLDSAIRDAQPAQLKQILRLAPGTKTLLLNGRKAQAGAHRVDWADVELVDLPSTSPANARVSAPDKLVLWRQAIKRGLQ